MTKKGKKTTVYEWFVVVEGFGEFAWDMLRYDCAFPASEQDTSLMVRREKRRIVVCRRSVDNSPGEFDRWASFGWKVIEATSERATARAYRRAFTRAHWRRDE